MAMVSRSPRQIIFQRESSDNLGPGAYFANDKVTAKASVSFTMSRNKQHDPITSSATPGPGHYDLPELYQTEKVLLINEQEGLMVIQKQKNNHFFKSKTLKIEDPSTRSITPGPGVYNPRGYWKSGQGNMSKGAFRVPQSTCALQEVFDKCNYKPVSSIPHKNSEQKHFFVEQQNKVNKWNHRIIHSGRIQNRFRKQNEENLKPGTSFGKSRCPRMPDSRADQKVGPGTYEPQLIPTKPPQQKRNQSSKDLYLKLLDKQKSKTRGESQSSLTQDSDQSFESIEYLKDSTPGPGSYDISLLSSVSKKTKFGKQIQRFGVKQKRFLTPKSYYTQLSFNQHNINQSDCKKSKLFKTAKKYQDLNVAFGRKMVDQKNVPLQDTAHLGPGCYAETRCIEKTALDNINTTYQGNFGANVQRFKQPVRKCSPDKFYSTEPMRPSYKSSNPNDYTFKSKCSRQPIINRNTSNVQFYSQGSNTLSQKVQNIKFEQEDKIVSKPGFNTSTTRFSRQLKQKKEFKTTQLLEPGQAYEKICKNSPAPSIPKAEYDRNLAARSNKPGPGEYNFQDVWNSRTYNILYI